MTVSEYIGYRAWKDWAAEGFGAFDAITAAYFASEMATSGMPNLDGKRVLEIGFGNGVFAGWCKGQGATYVGTEIIPELIARGRTAGFDVHAADRSLQAIVTNDSVDAVVAMDVFEHIEIGALRELLLQAKLCLRVGGLVVARVPSGDSPFARAIQHGDMTHRTVLGSSAVRQLADEVDLKVLQVREPTFLFRGLSATVRFRRIAIELTRRLTFALVTRAFMGGGTPVLTPNIIFVLKKSQ
jgi:2-polyprenyl-3-methyl-5-hydroxy-6-metoxy-1,4-benzoquinol methylase